MKIFDFIYEVKKINTKVFYLGQLSSLFQPHGHSCLCYIVSFSYFCPCDTFLITVHMRPL